MRFRELGVTVGRLPIGHDNAITDVDGVRVGQVTVSDGAGIQTGVTAILPHGDTLFTTPVSAAVHTINGFGKACGFEQVRELGILETPILLTNTLNVGVVAEACIAYTLERTPTARSINPLVGECNDGYLNDIQGRHVRQAQVLQAIDRASGGAVQEGAIGAGRGTSCYGHKGGIGTSSRCAGDYTVGTLLQTNFGRCEELTMLGVPLGQHLVADNAPDTGAGSVMIVIATDAPLTARQLGRLSRRAAFGLARTGTICHHGSGDFVIAFSTHRSPYQHSDTVLLADNTLFQAVVESVEESVYNALCAADSLTGYNGHHLAALDIDTVRAWLKHYRRL